MANLNPILHNPNLSKGLSRDSSCVYGINICRNIGLFELGRRCRNVDCYGVSNERRRRFQERQSGVLVSCSSSTEVGSAGGDGTLGVSEREFGYLVNEFGWKVRRLVEKDDEMKKVAQIQAEAFHIPVALFNDLFFQFFKAEVLSGLLYKIKNSPPDRYACLVAEPSESSNLGQELVGVVDVTVLGDEPVLWHLEGAEEYLYISGIAVLKDFRRKKVATALLKACDLLALLWGFEYLVLRAYEDDPAARKLYTNAGYRVVSGDPPWMTTWIGRKRRVLMIKQSFLHETQSVPSFLQAMYITKTKRNALLRRCKGVHTDG